jgi:hypothetical protein
MKIEFTQHRQLDALSHTVLPGDTLQSPDVPDELMQAYVNNGIAKDITPTSPSSDQAADLAAEPATETFDDTAVAPEEPANVS